MKTARAWTISGLTVFLGITALAEKSIKTKNSLYDEKEAEQIRLIKNSTDLINEETKCNDLKVKALIAYPDTSTYEFDRSLNQLEQKIRDNDARVKVLQDWMDEN